MALMPLQSMTSNNNNNTNMNYGSNFTMADHNSNWDRSPTATNDSNIIVVTHLQQQSSSHSELTRRSLIDAMDPLDQSHHGRCSTPSPPSSFSPSASSFSARPVSASPPPISMPIGRQQYTPGSVQDTAVLLTTQIANNRQPQSRTSTAPPSTTSFTKSLVVTTLQVVDELSTKNGPKMRHMADQILYQHHNVGTPESPGKSAEVPDAAVNDGGDFRAPSSTVEVVKAFDAVVREVLVDGRCCWGRVASVLTFIRFLVDGCVDGGIAKVGDGGSGELDELVTRLGRVVADRLGPWISKNGGWSEFERFFSRCRLSTTARLWGGFVAAVVELGTTAIVGVR